MKKRTEWLISLLCLGLLLSLCAYSYINFETYYPSLHGFLKNPESYHDKNAVLCGKIERLNADSFILKSGPDLIKVVYPDARQNRFGQVTVFGTFKADDKGYFLASSIGLFLLYYLLYT